MLALRLSTYTAAALCVLLLALITLRDGPSGLTLPSVLLTSPEAQSFKTLWISMILEALPFVLLGVFVSALLQQWVPESAIRRFMPRHPVAGILFACVMGIVFPLCECGMIPVIRRLMQKGMPAYVAAVFMTVGPIINPVVFASTYIAFRQRPEIAYSRMALAFVCALAIGLLVYKLVRANPLRLSAAAQRAAQAAQAARFAGEAATGAASAAPGKRLSLSGVLGHAADEFFDMGKYLIFGALLAAALQTFASRDSLTAIGSDGLGSHLFMMGLAFLLSLCSTSDAFVAASFQTSFPVGPLLTFLVFGPMLDIKCTLMLLSAFRARFVLLLSLLIVVIVPGASLLFERIFFT